MVAADVTRSRVRVHAEHGTDEYADRHNRIYYWLFVGNYYDTADALDLDSGDSSQS
jgi:hypothetical protein